jgi:hypothetical protein
MQAIGIILLLISVGTIVGPVGATVIVYRDDLSQLVITPQIRDIMNGNSNIFPNGNGNQNGNGDSGLGGLMSPTFVSAQSDVATQTFSAVFSVTNSFNYDLTLNSFSANALISQQQIPAGSLSLVNPVTVPAGQTSHLTIKGQWTQQAQDYIIANYPTSTAIDFFVKDVTININGIIVESSGTIEVGNVPFSMVG